MTGPANKRQKRQEYRDAQRLTQLSRRQEIAGAAATRAADGSADAEDRRHDEEVKAAAVGGGGAGDECGSGAVLKRKGIESRAAGVELPKKKFYRQRAHANPFSDHALVYPVSPSQMDWSTHYPAFVCPDQKPELGEPATMTRQVEIADVGCGFGGLLVALAPVFPDTLMIGMELRTQVLEYIETRIQALRLQQQQNANTTATDTATYQNISALRTNTMKYLPQFFHRHQLSRLFICFPDPHFKARKHKARIVSAQLNAEYGYVVRPGGKLYTITDVEEVAAWMVGCFEGRGKGKDGAGAGAGAGCRGVEELWERVDEDEVRADPCVRIMSEDTEEGKKVSRNGGSKYVAVWRRKWEDPKWPGES